MAGDIIDALLPVGVQLLGAKPRAGAESLLRDYTRAVALGTRALDRYQARQGSVLYIAPDLTRKAVQQLFDPAPPAGVQFAFNPPEGTAFLVWLREYLRTHPLTRLVVITSSRFLLDDASYERQHAIADDLTKTCHQHDAAVLMCRTYRAVAEPTEPVLGTLAFVARIDSVATLRGSSWGLRRLLITSRRAELDVEIT